MRTVAVVLPGIPATFTVDDFGGAHIGHTDATGYGESILSELTVTRVTVDAAGYQPYAAEGVVVPLDGNFQFRIGVPRDPARPQDVLLPALTPLAPPLPHLEVQGRYFVDAAGQRMPAVGLDGFMDLRLFKDGGEAALDPFMAEADAVRVAAGCDRILHIRRVYCQGAISQNQVMQLDPREPGYYDALRALVQYENAHGIVPLLTIGVDNQVLQLPAEHWAEVDRVTAGLARILSKYNEKDHPNHGDEDVLHLVLSGIWSQGSMTGDKEPDKPEGTLNEFHPVRTYATQMRDAVASPVQLTEVRGFLRGLLIDEPGRFGTNAHDDRFTNPETCGEYARAVGALCMGLIVHNYFGQRGLLMDPLTRACAEAVYHGMRE